MGASKEGVTAEPQTKIQGGDKDDAPRCWPGNPLESHGSFHCWFCLSPFNFSSNNPETKLIGGKKAS